MEKIKKYIMPFFLIFVIPLIVNFMLCYMFSDHIIKNIPIAVYVGDNSSFSRSIVKYFDDSDMFMVTEYVDSPYEIEKLIRENKVRMGIIIPDNFYKDLKSYKSPTILTVYDSTQLASVSFARAQVGETLLTLKSGVLIKILQAKMNLPFSVAKKMVLSIGIQNRLLFNPSKNYLNFLMPGFMAAILQSGLAMASAVAVDREKRRTMATYLLSKILVYTMLGFASLMMNLYIQSQIFKVPFRGNISEVIYLSLAFTFTVSTIGISISTIIWDKVMAAQAAAIMFIPNTIMVGYTWPLLGMPDIYRVVAKYIPFYYYADNIRDMMLKGYITNFDYSVRYLLKVSFLFFVLAITIEIIRERIISKRKKGSETVENV